jgi:hypothetical protein
MSGQGTHTTTTARLFHFPNGGDLIDSPGIREFGLGHVSRDDVEAGFIEFNDLIGTCRFRDCKHDREPGCACSRPWKRPRAAAADEQLPLDHRQPAGRQLLRLRQSALGSQALWEQVRPRSRRRCMAPALPVFAVNPPPQALHKNKTPVTA